MLGMGHLLCGTLTGPEDTRTAVLGGTKAVPAAETDSSSVGQDGVGIQPCLSPSIRRDTQSYLPVCNWWARDFLHRRKRCPSFSVPGCSRARTPDRDCPQCLDWTNRESPWEQSRSGQSQAKPWRVKWEGGSMIQAASPQGSAAPAGGNTS